MVVFPSSQASPLCRVPSPQAPNAVHTPPTQDCPAPQASPQEEQFMAVPRVVQTPPQRTVPTAHMHIDGEPEQVHPDSTVHIGEQPSPLEVFASSHPSEPLT